MWRTEDRFAVATGMTIRRADHFAAVGTRFEMIGRNVLITDVALAEVTLAMILVAVRTVDRVLSTHRRVTGGAGTKMVVANRLTAYITLRRMRSTDGGTVNRARLEPALDVVFRAVFTVSGVFRAEDARRFDRFDLISRTESAITHKTRLEMVLARR